MQVVFYRLLTYVLLPVALLFGFLSLFLLATAMGNITLLLPLFLTVTTVIYILSSLRFLHNGILPNRPLKPSLKDWVRVNGFVALFVGSSFLVQGFMLKNNPDLKEQLVIQYEQLKLQMPEQEELPPVYFEKILKAVLIVMMIIGGVLVVHVLITLQWLNRYKHLFEPHKFPEDEVNAG